MPAGKPPTLLQKLRRYIREHGGGRMRMKGYRITVVEPMRDEEGKATVDVTISVRVMSDGKLGRVEYERAGGGSVSRVFREHAADVIVPEIQSIIELVKNQQ